MALTQKQRARSAVFRLHRIRKILEDVSVDLEKVIGESQNEETSDGSIDKCEWEGLSPINTHLRSLIFWIGNIPSPFKSKR